MINEDSANVEWVPSVTKRFFFACDGPDNPPQGLYMIFDEVVPGQLLRVFLKRGHTGLCVQALFEAIGRLLTIIIQRTDVDMERVVRTLIGITCHGGMVGRVSCLDALAKELRSRYPSRFIPDNDAEDLACAPTD